MTTSQNTKSNQSLKERFKPNQHVFYIKLKLKAVVKTVDENLNKIYISYHPRGGDKPRVNKWVDAKYITEWKTPEIRKKNSIVVKNIESKTNRYYNQVRQFHEAFGQPAPDSPIRLTEDRKNTRISWMLEEIDEHKNADTIYDEVDGLIDLIYFAVGSLVEMGVKPDPIFNIVNQANLNKLWSDGKPRFREGDSKIIKPEGWVAPEPQIKAEIDRQIAEAV